MPKTISYTPCNVSNKINQTMIRHYLVRTSRGLCLKNKELNGMKKSKINMAKLVTLMYMIFSHFYTLIYLCVQTFYIGILVLLAGKYFFF